MNNFAVELDRIRAGLNDRGPMIPTFLGLGFYPFDPRPEEIYIEDIAHGLAGVSRFGGQARDEANVARHSVLVAALTAPDDDVVQLQALFHDAEEGLGLPDLITEVKKLFPGYQAVQRRIAETVFEKFNLPFPEPASVHMADRMALALERRDLVNENPAPCWQTMPSDLPPIVLKDCSKADSKAMFLWAHDVLMEGHTLSIDLLKEAWPQAFSPASVEAAPTP